MAFRNIVILRDRGFCKTTEAVAVLIFANHMIPGGIYKPFSSPPTLENYSCHVIFMNLENGKRISFKPQL